MLLISDSTQANNRPTIVALGVTRSQGGLHCEIIYIEPTPGQDGEHAPEAAGPLTARFWPDQRSAPTPVIVDWPGLTTSVPLSTRLHENIVLKEVEHVEEENQQQENPGE